MMGRKFNLVYDGDMKFKDTLCEVCGEKTLPTAMICNDCFEVLKELILERKEYIKKYKNKEPFVSDNFQIGPNGAFEMIEIDKEQLYKLYMEWVDDVAEECDWKTHFEPKEIVYAIAKILETNPELIK
jgi:uncharacterized OB-fold protein